MKSISQFVGQTHFTSAVPNFKLKINNMIEFKARGNVLLEARGNGSTMFNKFQYVDFQNMKSIFIDSIEKKCYEINEQGV